MVLTQSNLAADWDGAWKESLTALLPQFLALFFPKVYADIDWSRGFEALDKELQKIAVESATGSRRVDLLFRVWLRSGQERWVLIHIEVQAQREADFPERIFVYHHRIRDFYGQAPATFAVLIDDDPSWRPTSYAYDLWDCRNEFQFPSVKLLDFAGRKAELEKSDNPFAVVVLAHLAARDTANDRAHRRIWKVRLLKGLYNRGWDRKDIRELIKLIDWFLKLGRDDDRLVRAEIEADEKEKQMPYITSFEQMAMEEGEARGEARGLKNGIALALRLKFGQASLQILDEIQQIDDFQVLRKITQAIESAATLNDVRNVWTG
jgi:hypothetical protein